MALLIASLAACSVSQPQVIARRIYDRLVAQTGDLRHFPQRHIGAHRDNTGEDLAWIRLVFNVAVQDMGEGA